MTQVRLSTKVYNRPARDGSPRFQARFFAEGIVNPLMVKSLGKQFANKGQANKEAGRLLATLQPDLLRLYDSKLSGLEREQQVEDSFRQQPFGQFVTDFWTAGKSAYLESLASAGTPLSGMYVAKRLSKAVEYVLPYQPFSRPLCKVSLLLIEQFFRSLRSDGVEDNVLEPIKKTLQKPISYAIERSLIDVPFEMKGAKIPKPKYEKRGILTAEQVVAIFAVPTVPLRIIPTRTGDQLYHEKRPRLKKGETHAQLAPADIREKAFVYASLKSGLRRGELRALRWEHLELGEKPAIHVKENFVPVDGTKEPKYGSTRSLAMSDVSRPSNHIEGTEGGGRPNRLWKSK